MHCAESKTEPGHIARLRSGRRPATHGTAIVDCGPERPKAYQRASAAPAARTDRSALGSFVTSAKARYVELNVSGISEPFRLKPNLQDVVDYVNAFRRTASGRALIAAGLDLVELFNGARATLFAGKEPTKFELVTENGKLLMREVKPAFKDALKVQPKKPAKKEPKSDTVKKPRTTAAQRAAEIDGEAARYEKAIKSAGIKAE